jgi:hypothetical protein
MQGEEMEETCLIDRVRKKKGWMFWGSFHGATKGPGIFWEKDWGMITQESYCAHTVPVIHGWMRMNPGLVLMQDGAPGHSAGETQTDLRERDITPVFWPAFSPDLNPIETLWNIMKDYLENHYPEEDCSYDQLRAHVKEAWDSISSDQLLDLLKTMPQRCEDVIAAEGGHTKW